MGSQVTVRFWAGARRAAGHAEEACTAASLGELRGRLAARTELAAIVAASSFLVNGERAADEAPLPAGAVVDVLPPFAGGAADDPLIVGIGGSTRPGSMTGQLLAACLDEVRLLGARTRTVEGAELAALPIYSGDEPEPGAAGLLEAVRGADCVVIATPGYHGGMSGLVKNALDHLEALRADERPYLDGRAVGVIVSAAGWQSCGTALVSVRSAIHALRGWPTPFGVTVNSVEQDVADERVRGALRILAGQLVEFASWRRAAQVTAAR